jgi:hypothetical protein
LPHDTVVSWYRVILEDEAAVPDPLEQDPYLRAAADLARAEAQLQRVRLAEERWLLGPEPPPTWQFTAKKARESTIWILIESALDAGLLEVPPEERLFLPKGMPRHPEWEHVDLLRRFIEHPAVRKGWDPEGFRLMRRLDKAVPREQWQTETRHRKMGRTLARYRASAEARRRTALSRWIDQIVLRTSEETT